VERSSILVISDTHGNVPALTAVLGWARDAGFAAAMFLGDGTDDLPVASAHAGFTVPWYKVRGNLDQSFSVQDSLTVEIPAGQPDAPSVRTFFLAHGNRYGVEKGGETIAAAAKAAGAEAALFGHTHVPYSAFVDGIFLLNPGSLGRSRVNAGPTFAVVECPSGGPLSAGFYCLVSKGKQFEVRKAEL